MQAFSRARAAPVITACARAASRSITCRRRRSATPATRRSRGSPRRSATTASPGNCQSCHNGTTSTGKPVGAHDDRARLQCLPLDDARGPRSPSATPRPSIRAITAALSRAHAATRPTPIRRPGARRHTDPTAPAVTPATTSPDPHDKVEGRSKYTVSELRNCSGACHVYADTTLTTIRKNRPGAAASCERRRLRLIEDAADSHVSAPGSCCAAALVAPLAWGQAVRVMDAVDVVRTPTHIDVAVLFACDIRYVTPFPCEPTATELHVRLTLCGDCGSPGALRSETCRPSLRIVEIVRSLELVAADRERSRSRVRWTREEKFVVIPAGDQRGLRIRLVRPDAKSAQQGDHQRTCGRPHDRLCDQSRFCATAIRRAGRCDAAQQRRFGTPRLRFRNRRRRGALVSTATRPDRDTRRGGAHCYSMRRRAIRAPGSPSRTRRSSMPRSRRGHPSSPVATTPAPTAADDRSDRCLLRRRARALSAQELRQPPSNCSRSPARAGASHSAPQLASSWDSRENATDSSRMPKRSTKRTCASSPTIRTRRGCAGVCTRCEAATLVGRTGASGPDETTDWRIFGGISQYYRRDTNQITTPARRPTLRARMRC